MLKYYKHYFKGLAIADQQVAHTDEEQAYFFVRDRFNPDAFDNALRSVAKTPALLLEPYGWKSADGNSRNYFKFLSGRFNILAKGDIGDEDSIQAAEELCEAIAEDILAKMHEDLGEGGTIEIDPGNVSKKIFFKLADVTIDPIGPVCADYYGISVGFEWKTSLKATSNAANWSQQ